MPETRTFNPDDGNELGKLVREALGETIRPVEPGTAPSGQASANPAETDPVLDKPLVDVPWQWASGLVPPPSES